MKYGYSIIYDIQKDMWNWRDSLKNPFLGRSWINNVKDKNDLKIVKQILELEKKSAEKILKPYLLSQKETQNSRLNNFLKIIKKDFQKKYQNAIQVLETITQQPIMSDNFTFYITTFPRCPYFYEKREIFIYDSTEDYWGMPIDTFLHEVLHFQFIYYWYKNPKSAVLKLKYEDFDYLKEALTVVLDDELKPIISQSDQGYPSQIKYRKLLRQNWQKYHDFNKLVDFGLSKLNDFIKIKST